MKRTTIIGILFTILFGSLLHFTYEWSGNNRIVALFSAVNESTWEHLKLLFFPYVLYTIIEYYYIGKNYSNFITAKVFGILAGLITIPVIFNTYTAILGSNYFILDILTFIIAVIISYAVSYFLFKKETIMFNKIALIMLIIIMVSFFVFTFMPPQLNIFLDPVTSTYGI